MVSSDLTRGWYLDHKCEDCARRRDTLYEDAEMDSWCAFQGEPVDREDVACPMWVKMPAQHRPGQLDTRK